MSRSSANAVAIGAALRSGLPVLRRRALAELAMAFRVAHGNLVRAGEALNIPHRTMSRWVAEHEDVRELLERARAKGGA